MFSIELINAWSLPAQETTRSCCDDAITSGVSKLGKAATATGLGAARAVASTAAVGETRPTVDSKEKASMVLLRASIEAVGFAGRVCSVGLGDMVLAVVDSTGRFVMLHPDTGRGEVFRAGFRLARPP